MTTYTLQQFGQMVKQKYPEYKNIPDEQLAQAMIQKYPVYAQVVSGAQPVGGDGQMASASVMPTQQPSSGFQEINDPTLAGQTSVQGGLMDKVVGGAKKVGGFIGRATGLAGYGKGVMDAVRTGVGMAETGAAEGMNAQADSLIQQAKRLPVGNPLRKQLLAQAQQILSGAEGKTQSALGRFDKVTTTPKQMLGSTGKLALTVGGFAAGAPATAAGRIGMGTAFGGGFGAADAMEKNLGTEDILKSAGIGAVTGGVTAGLFEGVRWAVQNLPKRLMGGVSGLTNKQMQSPKGQKAIEYALKTKKVGTRAQLIKHGQSAIDKLDDQITTQLSGAKGSIKPLKIAQDLADDMNAKGWETSSDDVFGEMQKMFPNAAKYLSKKRLTVQEANELRKIVDKAVRPSSWLSSQPTSTQEFAMSVRRALSETVKNAAPSTRDLFSNYANEITLLEGLERVAAQTGNNKILTLGDLILGGSFGGAGMFAGGPTGVIAGTSAILANKALHSTLLNSSAARFIPVIGNIMTKLAPQEQQALEQILLDAFGPKQ